MLGTHGATALSVAIFATCVSAQTAGKADVPLDAAGVFKRASAAVVTITTPSGFGSGVIVDPSGVIATNLHVVQGDSHATVTLANHDSYDDVDVIDVDPRKDLVLLKVKAFKLPSLALGDSDDLLVGNAVYAIGAPKGLELTLSEGIVSGLRDSGEGYRVIQTSAAISPGSSGGGLFNGHGDLVGITTYRIEGGENLNFAVPVNYIRGMLATAPKLSLAELAAKYPAAAATAVDAGAAGDAAPVTGTAPRLAQFYAKTDGSLVVFEQEGASVMTTWSTATGVVYAHTTSTWDAGKKAFVGEGTRQMKCRANLYEFQVIEEVYAVSDHVIRIRATTPANFNCRKGVVTSYGWEEHLWYVPQK
jgi:S1-C subfamily serine protease